MKLWKRNNESDSISESSRKSSFVVENDKSEQKIKIIQVNSFESLVQDDEEKIKSQSLVINDEAQIKKFVIAPSPRCSDYNMAQVLKPIQEDSESKECNSVMTPGMKLSMKG